MVNNGQNLVNVVKGRPLTRGLRHRLCELLQLQFSLSFRSGLTFGWNELLLYLCRSRGSIVYLDIFFHFLYSFCLYICVLNKRCTIQRLSLFVYNTQKSNEQSIISCILVYLTILCVALIQNNLYQTNIFFWFKTFFFLLRKIKLVPCESRI